MNFFSISMIELLGGVHFSISHVQARPFEAARPSIELLDPIGVSIERKRAGLETPRATINTDDYALARSVGAHELERSRHGANAEEPLSGAEDHRKGQKPVFVNEVLLDQRLGKTATPVNLHLA